MVDIHSHILWGMDDGSRSLDMSVAMLRMAAAGGTTDIVATPHADADYLFQPDLIAERRAELQGLLGDAIRIHTGCEFHLKYENIQEALADPRKFSVNGLGWVLVEFSDMMIFPNTEDIFARMRNAGMGIIVTHPERNWLLRKDLDRLQRWVEGGAYLQVTGGSLTGRLRRGRAEVFRGADGSRTWSIFWPATRTISTAVRRAWTKCVST